DQESFEMTREIVAKEGICVGPSSAMALVGAIKYSETLKEPANILIMMADSGRAYLSKAFNDDWLKENEFMPSPMRTTSVADLLSHRSKDYPVISANVDHNVMEVVNLLKENGISQVPVFSDQKLVGVLDETDLILPLATGKLKPTEPIIHLIKGSIVWVDPSDSLESLSNHFQKGFVALLKGEDEKIHIITKIDLLEFISEHLGQ
ncbi:MAG: CBS domain-containing protein, partial [Pseudomonadota bacterium]